MPNELRVYCVVYAPAPLTVAQWVAYFLQAVQLGMGSGINAVAEASHERVWMYPIRPDGQAMVIDFEISSKHRAPLRAALETTIAQWPPALIDEALAPNRDARKMAAVMSQEAKLIMKSPAAFVEIIGYGERKKAIAAANKFLDLNQWRVESDD